MARSASAEADHEALRQIAARVESRESGEADPAELERAAALVRGLEPAGESVEALYLDAEDAALRRLAARLLDRGELPASEELTRRVLGAGAARVLGPYLSFTRASHLDLLDLVPAPGTPPPALDDLRRAEAACGPALLREAIGRLGWRSVNLGLDVRRWIGVSVAGSPPFQLHEPEAALLETCPGARRASDCRVLVGHGGRLDGAPDAPAPTGDPVARFRSSNLAHAALLDYFLDVTPLSRARVEAMLERMRGVVDDFLALFATRSEDCTILPDVWSGLERAIRAELGRDPADPVGPELTRLVQTFEDPRGLADVRTLHGLKRYLHQRGLTLGFRLPVSGRAANRTVALVLAEADHVVRVVQRIRYADFESAAVPSAATREIPFPVALAAAAWVRQLLAGQESFPHLDVFAYGNEVHYYLSFWQHPAFLRIDFAPPLRGGMIELEYRGVSNYELAEHPDPSLQGIVAVFGRLGFDVALDGARIHARYDKERERDLDGLRETAAQVLGLAPYFMDLDWTIGSLDLGADARAAVARAWAERFVLWGALPLHRLLTADRRGILLEPRRDGGATEETAWSGAGEYRDRHGPAPDSAALRPLFVALDRLGVETMPAGEAGGMGALGQLALERIALEPLREAIERGAVVEGVGGPLRESPDLFRFEHEAELLARVLAGEDEILVASARIARLVTPLERSLRFVVTGSVNGHEVARARLALRGETLTVAVLRGPRGIARLGLWARGQLLCRHRDRADGDWRATARFDPVELAALVRRADYLAPGEMPPPDVAVEAPQELRARLSRANPLGRTAPGPGERVVSGLAAAPGRAVGRVAFAGPRRSPEDLEGAIFVAAAVRPEDGPLLYRAAGVVSTGGGVLSHAGLIANQYGKPALVVPGRWRHEAGDPQRLDCAALEYVEEQALVGPHEVRLRSRLRPREHTLAEGDLVVVDADAGLLRVLGGEPIALGLHDELRRLARTARLEATARAEREMLRWRGERLRSLRRLERLLERIADPLLARHAVEELVRGEPVAPGPEAESARAALLSIVLRNPEVGGAAERHLLGIADALAERRSAAAERVAQRVPGSRCLYEILSSRLQVLELDQTLAAAAASITACGARSGAMPASAHEDPDPPVRERLVELAAELAAESLRTPAGDPRTRHLLRQRERVARVLGASSAPPDERELARADETLRRRLEERRLLWQDEAGFEVHTHVGWKAANLAEIGRLVGTTLVPPWFVVTHRAFAELMASPLGTAIAAVLERSDLGPAQQSAAIRALWERAEPSAELAGEVVAAYRALGGGADAEEPFVAVRSSAREEDTEAAPRAGEFSTYLFVRGAPALLEHLKSAWGGLWTERAIHNRSVLGAAAAAAGGGVIVQRMVRSRVAGVLQTVNVARGEPREIVIDVGLGLGEGIVGGIVAVDQYTVAKEGDLAAGPLRFRCLVGDKLERVVFNDRLGSGTVRRETPYHQRLRPCLEYVELLELVGAAARLEAAYGYPLDIEFAIEGTRLWILQARPVAAYLTALRRTEERYPLAGCCGAGGRR